MMRARRLLIAGGGPAGMIAGLLFARAGIPTLVLEKHGDFLRDFRGDTVHPSTLRLFHELGLLDRLLERPHDRVPDVHAYVAGRRLKVADFSRFDRRWNFVALMPQWDFLDFVAEAARAYPHFELRLESEAIELLRDRGRVCGVRASEKGGMRDHAADLVIAADGRKSALRPQSGLVLRTLGAPMDVFWFRVPKRRTPDNETTGIFTSGRIIALLDRGEYWQCAYVFPKDQADAVRARGLDAFRAEIDSAAPMLEGQMRTVTDWNEVKLLSVALDRLERWDAPGLLVIGDAAHAMSPVGGVGINIAIQDAVAAANLLAGPMAAGAVLDPLLPLVRRRRILQVASIQALQNAVQRRIIAPLLGGGGGAVPLPLRLMQLFPLLQTLPAALIGFGIRPEHVRSPLGRVRPSSSRD